MIDAYRARGWVPVPVQDKRPVEASWQTRTLSTPWPEGDYEIGLLLGDASGGLIDVDLDCSEATALAPAILPGTLTFGHRPERRHYLYVCKGFGKRAPYDCNGMIVEIRADGNQTVVPPSGGRAWGPWMEPTVVDAAELRRRVGLVAAMTLVMRHWPAGGRHEAQLALAGCLLSEGWDEAVTLGVLCAIAGEPDKREATVRRTAERVRDGEEVTGWGTLAIHLPPDVARLARGWLGKAPGRVEDVDRARLGGLAKTLLRSTQERRRHHGEVLARVALGDIVTEDLTELADLVGSQYPSADPDALARLFNGSCQGDVSRVGRVRVAIERGQRDAHERAATAFERKDHAELLKRTRAVLARGGELVSDAGLWRCEGGLWAPVDDGAVSKIVMGFSGAPVKKGGELEVFSSDVQAVTRLLGDTLARPGWFSGAPPGVAFQDVFVGEHDVKPLTGELRQTARYDWPWDPGATCPAWEGFLAETYAPDAIPVLQEFAGVALFGIATRYQRFLVLSGAGATGKSVVVSVLTGIMPRGVVASVAPHEWRKEYARATLIGIRLNTCSEMPSAELFDAESVKAVVAGDAVVGRHPYGRPLTFRPVAAHLFAANTLPPVRDSSTGFWRRAFVIGHDRVVDEHIQVAGLAEALLEAERPGIVAWAVAGAKRVLARGCYSPLTSSAVIVEEWRTNSDSVLGWLATVGKAGPDVWVKAAEAYDHYRSWAIGGGMQPCSITVWGTRLKGAGVRARRTNSGWTYALLLNGSSVDV